MSDSTPSRARTVRAYGWDMLPGLDVQRVGPWYETVANMTAHELMLDRFLALGFPRDAFLNRVAERQSPAALADATSRALQAGLWPRIAFSNYCVEYLSTWATARHLEDAGLRDVADEIEQRGRDLHPAFDNFGNVRDAYESRRFQDPSHFSAACDDLILRMGMTKGWYYRLRRDGRGPVFAQKVK